MKEKIENPNAFPTLQQHGDLQTWSTYEGMTMRDWFAGQALQGLIANSNTKNTGNELIVTSYKIAEEMLKQRTL